MLGRNFFFNIIKFVAIYHPLSLDNTTRKIVVKMKLPSLGCYFKKACGEKRAEKRRPYKNVFQ